MKYLAQIRDAILGYGLAFLAVVASLLWGMLQREKAQQATEDAARASAAQEASEDARDAYAESEHEFNRRVQDAKSARRGPGRFTQ